MASSFSIREYAATMRGTAASPHPLLSAGDFLPMPARKFSWWVDELHAAVRGKPAAARKKRPVSNLFAAAGDDVQTDEPPAAMEHWWKKPRPEEDEDDDDGVRKIEKRILFSSSTPNAPKVSVNKLHPPGSAQTFQIDERQKHINIENMRFEIWKPGKFKKHTLQCIGGTNTVNAHKLTNSAMANPKHGILKKHTKRSSITVRINEEKYSNLKGPEAIDLHRKLEKHVTFSGVDDMLIRNKISSTLPQLQNHRNVYSDNSNEDERLVAANTSSHKNKEACKHSLVLIRDRDIYDTGISESSGAKDSLNLIDLNRALLCTPDFNCTSISGSEVPDLEHTEDATSDLQVTGDVREAALKHNQNLNSKSQRLQCEQNSCDRGRIIDSRSIASLLPDEVTNISHRGMIGPPLISREFTNFYADYERSSVRDGTMKGKAPYILPHHTIQYTSQFAENCYTNMNLGNFHHTGREFSCCPCQNQLHAGKHILHSGINVQHEHAVISQHTMRLMGKDLTVSTTRGKCIGETTKEHISSSIRCHHSTNNFLELPREGHPFLSLQPQSFSNIQVDAPSTSHDYVGYRMHHLKRRFPEADVFSGNGIECEDRLRNFSYLRCGQNVPAGFSFLQGNCKTRSNQNSLSATTFLSTFMPPHAKQSSVYHTNSTWTCNPYPANLLVHPPDGTNFRKERNQIIRGVAEIPSAVDILSSDTVRKATKAHMDNSNISSGVKYIPRSGPVKLRPGAKHVLEPRQNTDDGNYPPRYSCMPFFIVRGGNILYGQTKRGRRV